MPTLTRNSADKSQLKLNGTVVIQAANGDGEAILEELIKFSKGNKYTTPTKLTYVKRSKCWTDYKGKIVLFNIAENETSAVELIESYMTGEKAHKAKTDVSAVPVSGIVATDSGVPLSLDTVEESSDPDDKNTKVMRVDKSTK